MQIFLIILMIGMLKKVDFMSKLQSYNGRYCESEFENAFLSFLEEEGWQYLHGNSVA